MNPTRRALLSLLAATAPFAATARAQCYTAQTAAYTEVYGDACGTPPVLGATTDPVLGTVTTLRTTNLAPQALLVVVAISFVPPGTPTGDLFGIPLGSGCENYLPDATELAITFPFVGAADVALAIPASPLWQGSVLHAQAFAVTLANGLELPEASNALCLSLGQ